MNITEIYIKGQRSPLTKITTFDVTQKEKSLKGKKNSFHEMIHGK